VLNTYLPSGARRQERFGFGTGRCVRDGFGPALAQTFRRKEHEDPGARKEAEMQVDKKLP
jgi:hypothetical protein